MAMLSPVGAPLLVLLVETVEVAAASVPQPHSRPLPTLPQMQLVDVTVPVVLVL